MRNGTADILVAFEPLAGWRRVRATERRCRRDRAAFVEEPADGRHKDADTIAPVTDRPNAHTPASPHGTFPPEEAGRLAERPEIRRTPKRGSWLDTAAVEPSVLDRGPPRRMGDGATLERRAAAWGQRRNAAQVEADWRFATADARTTLRKLYPSLEG